MVASLKEIKCNTEGTWNQESTTKGNGLYHSTVNLFLLHLRFSPGSSIAQVSFQFIVTLVVVSRCLKVTRPLTKQLQSASFDAGSAREHVTVLYVMLEKMRADIEERHESWFVETVTLAENVGTTPGMPRATGRQVH